MNRLNNDLGKIYGSSIFGLGFALGAGEIAAAATAATAATVALPVTLGVVGSSLIGCAIYQSIKTPIRHLREEYPNKKGEIYIIYTPIPQA